MTGFGTVEPAIEAMKRGAYDYILKPFKVEEVNPERHQLGLHVFFPLGLQEKPHIACYPIDATTCRVQYG